MSQQTFKGFSCQVDTPGHIRGVLKLLELLMMQVRKRNPQLSLLTGDMFTLLWTCSLLANG